LTGKKKDIDMSSEELAKETELSGEAEATDAANSIESELATAHEEIAALKDKLLRSHAEMDNLHKRSQRDVADAHKFGIEKFATALLEVMDNLERALDVEEGNEAAVRKGIELTLNSWQEMMKRFEVKRIDAMGQVFDPHHHEALSQMPSDEPAGTVIAQHVAGYTLHGRLIRPARVLVSSGPAAE